MAVTLVPLFCTLLVNCILPISLSNLNITILKPLLCVLPFHYNVSTLSLPCVYPLITMCLHSHYHVPTLLLQCVLPFSLTTVLLDHANTTLIKTLHPYIRFRYRSEDFIPPVLHPCPRPALSPVPDLEWFGRGLLPRPVKPPIPLTKQEEVRVEAKAEIVARFRWGDQNERRLPRCTYTHGA